MYAKAFVEEQEKELIAATGLRGDLIERSPRTIGAIDDPCNARQDGALQDLVNLNSLGELSGACIAAR